MHKKVDLENIFDNRMLNVLTDSKVLLIEMNRDIGNINILYSIAKLKSKTKIANSDIIIIDNQAATILKESVKSFKKELTSYSLTGSIRVGIINGLENMNTSSANSLLKFIEEPEENVYFVFGSANVNSVIETIRSRCTIVSVKKNTVSSEYDILKKNSSLLNFEEIVTIVLKFIDNLCSMHEIIYLRREKIDGFSRQEIELFLDLLIYEIHKNKEIILNAKKILSVLILERERFNKNLNIGLFLDNLVDKVVNYE